MGKRWPHEHGPAQAWDAKLDSVATGGHPGLDTLEWLSSGHTGTTGGNDMVAAFDGTTGEAKEIDIGTIKNGYFPGGWG